MPPKQKCQFCGEMFHLQGIGPHRKHCVENNGMPLKTQKKDPMWEKQDDGLFHCRWCERTTAWAPGMGAHASNAHHEEYKQLKAEMGHTEKRRSSSSVLVSGAIKSVSKARGRMQRNACGVDLTEIPLDKLPVLIKNARNEIEARCKDLLASC